MSSTSRIANLIDISIHLKKLPLLKIKKRKLKGDDFYLKKIQYCTVTPTDFRFSFKTSNSSRKGKQGFSTLEESFGLVCNEFTRVEINKQLNASHSRLSKILLPTINYHVLFFVYMFD